MYIERGIYDWRQTASLITVIYNTVPTKKSKIDPEEINIFLQMKEKKRQSSSRIPLSSLADFLPGIKVVDKRQKS